MLILVHGLVYYIFKPKKRGTPMEHILQSINNLLTEKATTWYNNIRDNVKNQEDFERAIETICEVLRNLGVSELEIGKLIPPIQEDRIDTVIHCIQKERKFQVKKKDKTSTDILAEWELTKYNSNSFLYIELKKENYIHICGNDWNLLALGYFTLSNAIKSWEEGRM